MKKQIEKIAVLLFSIIFASCNADIQKLYNDGDSFEIEFESCIPKVQEFVFQPIEGNKCYFKYDKKNHTAYLNLNDTERRHKQCNNIVYNALLSDQNHLCLQDDYYRFIIENAGSEYIMHLYVYVYNEWKCVATFTQNEKDKTRTSIPVKDVLDGKHIEKKTTNNATSTNNMPEFDEQGGLLYKIVRGNSYDGYVSIREDKSSKSKEIGRLSNNEVASYLATEGDWFKIDYNGIKGYVYNKYSIIETMVDP